MDQIDPSAPLRHDKEIDRPVNTGNPEMKFGSDAVAEVTRALGYPYIALVPGASYRGFHDSIVNYLGNETPQMVVCLHEEHAVAIADGYAKVTDTPMAVALHSNVGLMHASMAIFNAWCNRSPMLIFGANGPIDADKRRPWIEWVHTTKDQASMIRDYIKWDDEPQSPRAAVESVLRADQITRTPPFGPVYVCLDAELQESEIVDPVEIPSVERFRPPEPSVPATPVLDQILSVIRGADFPLLLVGRVSRSEEEWGRRVALAEALGMPVATSLHTPSGFPTQHPLHCLPPCGERPGDMDAALLKRADVILSLDWVDLAGYIRQCVGETQTQKPLAAKVIQCSMEPIAANGWSMNYQALPAVDINILCRPDDVVAALLNRIGEPKEAPPSRDLPAHWTETPADYKRSASGEPMTRRELAEVVSAFSASRPVTLARAPIGWAGEACKFDGPLDYLAKDAGGAVGSGLGNAVGSALALKDSDRLVISVVGDGDYLMGVNALWTASRMDLPLMVVVANNRSYFNDELHQERVADARDRPAENRWIGQRLDEPAPDIVGLARAQGFDGEGPLHDIDELLTALETGEKVLRAGGRYVIDARCSGY